MNYYQSLVDKNRHFKDSITINSTTKLDQLMVLLTKLPQNQTNHTVFRGVNEARYKLFNSLQRQWAKRDMGSLDGIKLSDRVSSMLNEFHDSKSILIKYLKRLGVSYNDWYALSLLQHNGVPTPLLDFSRDPKVALFFACNNIEYKDSDSDIDHYVSIYYYSNMEICRDTPIKLFTKIASSIIADKDPNTIDKDRVWLNELSFDNISKYHTTFIVPSYTNATNITNKNGNVITTYTVANLNLTGQDGEFICNIDEKKPLEELLVKDGTPYITCINIHKGLIGYALHRHLNATSIEEAQRQYYPSEQDIAQKAKDRLFSLK